jgi:L-ascorbate metabolism protein UlaG (beta-lactamase superfamily)
LSADKTIAVYCRSGRRSASAAERLAREGFQCVNLKGGIVAWKEARMPVTTDTYEVDVFRTKSGKTLRCHALMHASIRIQYDGKEIEIDPVSKLGERTIPYATMPKADYIFVTHEHFDHFDKEAIATLSSDKTKLITNQRCAEMLGKGQAMANGETLRLTDDITVEAVPAYNTTEGHQQFHPKGRDNGFILTIDGLRIYIAGDTEDIPEMADIKEIDIAFLPCNQPYTMTTDQLVRAAKIIKPKVVFPYHYSQTDVNQLPAQLKDEGIEVRIRHYE